MTLLSWPSHCTGSVSEIKQVKRHTPCIHLSSHTIHHTSHITHHTPHITHHTSHTIHHTSHITHHTSHITRHTSHITHHTSHITHHTSHIITSGSASRGGQLASASCGLNCARRSAANIAGGCDGVDAAAAGAHSLPTFGHILSCWTGGEGAGEPRECE
jgi:hypothetical protein